MNTPQRLTNLDDVLTQWAEKVGSVMFATNPENHTVVINWDNVTFTPLETTWTKAQNSTPTPPNTTIYQTSFTNNTDHSAQNNLKVDRTTKATLRAVLVKGFARSSDMKLSLELPKDASSAVNVFGQTFTLDQSGQTTIEQQQTWSVDSLIPTPPRSVTRARVDLKENHWEGNFAVEVKIRGTVVVNFYESRAPKKFIGVVESDVANALGQYAMDITPNGVLWKMEGICSFRFGEEQMVVLEHEFRED